MPAAAAAAPDPAAEEVDEDLIWFQNHSQHEAKLFLTALKGFVQSGNKDKFYDNLFPLFIGHDDHRRSDIIDAVRNSDDSIY